MHTGTDGLFLDASHDVAFATHLLRMSFCFKFSGGGHLWGQKLQIECLSFVSPWSSVIITGCFPLSNRYPTSISSSLHFNISARDTQESLGVRVVPVIKVICAVKGSRWSVYGCRIPQHLFGTFWR